MARTTSQFTLNLLGPFRLSAPDNRRVEIASKKGVALIAMLATAKDAERTRSWLQEKLWGSREPLQAQASLRRELSNLRRSLNTPERTLLICERDRVQLDLRNILVDVRQPEMFETAPDLTEGEFLEGLDIMGGGDFEDWLREQRALLQERRQ